MAVVNLTPDSFFAPSRVRAREAADRVRLLLDAGADLIDLGAVSTRPGAADVSLREEWRRLSPVVRAWDRGVPLWPFAINGFQRRWRSTFPAARPCARSARQCRGRPS